jgi:hypothetical protein
MLRMQEMTFPGFKFQTFSGGVHPQTLPPFMRGILATNVAFSHCYPPLIYYLTERSLFKKCPPTGKSLKKALLGFSYDFGVTRNSSSNADAMALASACLRGIHPPDIIQNGKRPGGDAS